MNTLPATYREYQFEGISQFRETLKKRNCRYYASELLRAGDPEKLKMVDLSVHRAMKIFASLHQQTGSHFSKVYRGHSMGLYRDWRLSELACIYLLMDGDPEDLISLAHQQSSLIDQMLHHVVELHASARTR